jgi:3-dehydroquinate dehydratase-1
MPHAMRPITLQGRPLAGGRLPAVCVPLVARTADALQAEARAAAAAGPDLLEWRVDFFDAIADTAAVVAVARSLRSATGLPLLFTRRSVREGGQTIPLDEPAVLALQQAVCAGGAADLLDVEMEADPAHVAAMRAATAAAGIGLVLSFHDFQRTPPAQALLARYRQAAALGADLAKIAVMPQSPADVLTLLQATLAASGELAIPVAGMAMGGLGAVSRVAGGAFGSALTFGVGQAASAPGQLPVAGLRAALDLLGRAA